MKHCSMCQEDKSVADFNKHAKRKDGLQTVCRDCNRLQAKRYYAENGPKHRRVCTERAQRVRADSKRQMCSYLEMHPCVDCGETDIVVLEFDHLRDKTCAVATLLGSAHAWERIAAEIAKCEVVCCNCHRRRTAQRGGSYRLDHQSLANSTVE